MSYTRLRPSFALTEDRLADLRAVLPEVFADGKINWGTLKEALAPDLEEERPDAEHFGLFWPGKRQARRMAATPSRGALHPAPGEGIAEETTHNVFIEGDNLEVLKLLLKSYAGSVKMIYIDPPYNTGNDFVYKDNYAEALDDYRMRTGQIDESNAPLTTNTKAAGRIHSNWLSMMYPRLLLARQFLQDDGILFASIDDNEGHNLRLLMHEVFGEENYLTTLYVQVRYPDKTLVEDADFHKLIEMVLVYRKSPSAVLNKPSMAYSLDKFMWTIEEAGDPAETLVLGGKTVEMFPTGRYEIVRGLPSRDGLKEIWATGKILDGNSSGRFFRDYLSGRSGIDGYGALYKVYGIGADSQTYRYFTGPKRPGATKGKYYQGVPRDVLDRVDETQRSQPISNFYNFADSFGNCRHEGGIDFRSGKKPIEFIKTLPKLGSSNEGQELILDFFAGSCSTAHAVVDLNREDGGQRRYICVQVAEPIRQSEDEFNTIADLGKERICRVLRKMRPQDDGQLRLGMQEFDVDEDLGLRVFNLAHSNFKRWHDYEGDDKAELGSLFDQFESPLVEDWKPSDLLTEVMLLQGFPLDSKIAGLDGFAPNRVLNVATDAFSHNLYVCLDPEVSDGTVNRLTLNSDDVFVCLDSALSDEGKQRLADVCNLQTI
jgi:adenine-specific DNA-methyltransferase